MRKPFLIVAGKKMPGICGGYRNLSIFRELNIFDPCGNISSHILTDRPTDEVSYLPNTYWYWESTQKIAVYLS